MQFRSGGIPWPRVDDFLAEVGAERTVWDFKRTVLRKIYAVLPFDNAAAWLEMGGERPTKMIDEVGVSRDWVNAHNDYYYRLSPVFTELCENKTYLCDWSAMPDNEYRRDFIEPQKIRYGAGLIISGGRNNSALCLSLTDSGNNYRRRERVKMLLKIIRRHLANYYSFLDLIPQLENCDFHAAELASGCRTLSKREAEVAALLCKRLTAAEIASLLMISPWTAERHIANIYEKLRVGNRRELLLKLAKWR